MSAYTTYIYKLTSRVVTTALSGQSDRIGAAAALRGGGLTRNRVAEWQGYFLHLGTASALIGAHGRGDGHGLAMHRLDRPALPDGE